MVSLFSCWRFWSCLVSLGSSNSGILHVLYLLFLNLICFSWRDQFWWLFLISNRSFSGSGCSGLDSMEIEHCRTRCGGADMGRRRAFSRSCGSGWCKINIILARATVLFISIIMISWLKQCVINLGRILSVIIRLWSVTSNRWIIGCLYVWIYEAVLYWVFVLQVTLGIVNWRLVSTVLMV